MKLSWIYFLSLLALLDCKEADTSTIQHAALSAEEYSVFRKTLRRTRGKTRIDSIMESYLAIYNYAMKYRYDTCSDFIRKNKIRKFFAMGRVSESMAGEITKYVTRPRETELDTVKEFISKKLTFTSIASPDFDYLRNRFNGSEGKTEKFNEVLGEMTHNSKLIVREYTSEWPLYIPPLDYQKALVNAEENDIIGPVQSDDVLSYLRVNSVWPVNIDHISQDSIRKIAFELKKIRRINSVIGKFIFESKIQITEEAADILSHYLENPENSDPTILNEKKKVLFTYLKEGVLQEITLGYFLKFHNMEELLSIRQNPDKLTKKVSDFGRRQLIYEFAVKTGIDGLRITKYQDRINFIIALSNFTINKMARDSIEHNKDLVRDYYTDHIQNYTAHTNVTVDHLTFSDMNKCSRAYSKHRNELFDLARSQTIEGLLAYNPQVKLDYYSLTDPVLREILFFYKKGVFKGSVKVKEETTGKAHMYYVLEKSGTHELPFTDIQKVVENDLQREMSEKIIAHIRTLN